MINLFNKLRAVNTLSVGKYSKISLKKHFFIGVCIILSFIGYVYFINISDSQLTLMVFVLAFQHTHIPSYYGTYINNLKFKKTIVIIHKILIYYIILIIFLAFTIIFRKFNIYLLYEFLITINFLNSIIVPIFVRNNRIVKSLILGSILLFSLVLPINYILDSSYNNLIKILLLFIINIFTLIIGVILAKDNYKSKRKRGYII
ncbi:hypothetical protein [Gemelliphila palaticanis]|uniref:Uncharacterized protein n=1 Tax=Gemelliphila palaticanis TaxID=81950 RepID=A0ABX2T086_9BACL|nr:hypothetical protein [Gemella palaticanis]MBF0715852.1 hypothetical protein [Gemella palaticanis]NYS47782.1 hypothetical protein [Gemella palaticanis]